MESGSDRKPPAWPERPAPARGQDQAATLARIERLARSARFAWLGLIGYLAFVGLTLLSVRDVDFFSVTAQTTLPIVGIAIPTLTFFWMGPLLGAVLHVYLHLHLVKLWDALAAAPAQIERIPLGDHVAPWVVIDWALHQRGDGAVTPRPLDRIGSLVTGLLVWWAAPLVLAAFWWRSMPAHEEWMTLTIAAEMSASVYATLRSRRHARRRPTSPHQYGTLRASATVAIVAVLVQVSWLRTEGGLDNYARLAASFVDPDVLFKCPSEETSSEEPAAGNSIWQRRRTAALTICAWGRALELAPEVLASIDLREAELAVRPPDWLGRESAERRFRVGWCNDKGLSLDACDNGMKQYYPFARIRWCERQAVKDDCLSIFERLDADLAAAWAEGRGEYLAGLVRPNLSGRDLRRANATGAFLTKVDLQWARLEGAWLLNARLEGANLGFSRLKGAQLSGARLEGAWLVGAQLEGAWLSGARLEGARFLFAGLEGASLNGAHLEGADFVGARLNGANLTRAKLDGADLTGADLNGAQLTETVFGATLTHQANFSNVIGLTQAQLAQVIGDQDTVLPRDSMTDEQLYVWSCWHILPPSIKRELNRFHLRYPGEWSPHWLCPPGEAPLRVGKPAL